MMNKTIDDLLGDFSPKQLQESSSIKDPTTLTLWIPKETKQRYDRIQKMSKNRLSKVLREAVTALIEEAEARAS